MAKLKFENILFCNLNHKSNIWLHDFRHGLYLDV